MDLAIAIRIGSPQSKIELVKETIESIEKNMGECSYRFILSLGENIPQEIKGYIKNKASKNKNRFFIMTENIEYWADFINRAIELAQDCEYFIKSHDDISLMTKDFFPKVKKYLSQIKEPIAWINFDDTAYLDGHWAPPTRPGFHKDFLEENTWDKRKMFQFHTLPDNWWVPSPIKQIPYIFQQRILSKIIPGISILKYPGLKMSEEQKKLLDFPKRPVKCHAPWNMFVMIKTSVLKEIGPCENWKTGHALFVDEDWGLRALKLKYWNIWLPDIQYCHIRPTVGGDRAQFQIIDDRKRVGELFRQKWGFHVKPDNKELEVIKNNNNFIPWSIGKNSYDWEYVK